MNKVFNTGETQDDLRAMYNPDGSTLRKAQIRMLEMLGYLDSVMKELGIEYFLSCGNVIGALRHGGFIPWDDDVDVSIRREDMARLCDFLEKHPHDQFKIQTRNTDDGFWGIWPVLRDTKSEYIQDDIVHKVRKFRGLQIDIFTMEEMSSRSLHWVCCALYVKLVAPFIGRSRVCANLFYYLVVRLLFPAVRFLCRLFGKGDKIMYPLGSSWHMTFSKKFIFPLGSVEFEGKQYPAPIVPDKYLEEEFGPFMDLPDRDSRNKHKAEYKIWD